MKKTTYILTVLSVIAAAFMAWSCNKNESIEPSHLVYFGINAPYLRFGDIPFTVNQLTREITNDEPIPGNIDLSKVTPWFFTNDGKGVVTVKGVTQESGKTNQNLRSPVEYVVTDGASSIKYTVKLTQSEHCQTQVAVKVQGKSPALMSEIVNEKEVSVANGVRYTEVEFNTSKGLNWRLHVVEADLADAGLTIRPLVAGGLKQAPGEGEEWPVSDIGAMAGASGFSVLAAVSGDYMSVPGAIPEGGLLIDGKLWKSSFADTKGMYFGLRKDGRMSMGDGDQFMNMMEKLDQAISSRPILLEDGVTAADAKSDKTRASRVAIGTNTYDMKTLYLVGIDAVGGSEGCTMAELGEIMADLGTGHAINLVGGENMSFFVKEGGSLHSVLKDKNIPQIVNSIALVVKK